MDQGNGSACKACSTEIPPGAAKCVHCGEWQYLTARFAKISVPVLSLLVALAALLITGQQEIRLLVAGPKAALLVGGANPTSDDETLFTFTNEGTKSTIVEGIECAWYKQWGDLEYWLNVYMEPPVNPVVRPQQTVEGKFLVVSRYWTRYGEEHGSVTELKMSHLMSFIKPANACCGVPTAKCTVFHRDGSAGRKEAQFWTAKMLDWHDSLSASFEKEVPAYFVNPDDASQ